MRKLSNAVDGGEYIEKLRSAILERHGCKSSWVESVPVHDVFVGETMWKGFVEVFTLSGHPKAKKAYAWMGQEGDARGNRIETVLGIPPVESPLSAVWASIIADQIRGL